MEIVYRAISLHLIKKAGYSRKAAHTGAVTLIQRFRGALNLKIHIHMLFPDGVYVDRLDGSVRFRRFSSPTTEPPVGVRNWPKIATHFHVSSVRKGH